MTLDGRLSEPVWATAPAATDFTQEWPERGRAARQRTEVKVLFDDHFLYVGARMHHDRALDGGRATVVRRLHRRDQDSQSDWFGVALDAQHDRRTGLHFEVNAAGVQKDAVLFGDTSSDTSWDGVWESAVRVDDDGWTAELKIPLSLLRLQATTGPQTWGINFRRQDQGAVRESTLWHVVPRGQDAMVSRFPHLEGIEGVRPRLRRELLPYMSTLRKFETARSYDDRVWERRAGLDARMGLTAHSQAELTLMPDFGQVEVDQAVLNLGTVETFFPEKRVFFLEGSEIFRTIGPTLFYSRRIGAGVGDPALGPGEQLLARPAAADISAALKYTSKYNSGLNVGLLAARVDPARATVLQADGTSAKREVAPLTGYGVLRVQTPLDERGSFLGGFVSGVHQAGPMGRVANVAAVDGLFKSQDRRRTVDFALIRSEAGPKGAEVPGWFGRLTLTQNWGQGWSAYLANINVGRDFFINDLGYRDRFDEHLNQATILRRWDRTAGIFRNWEGGAEWGLRRDQAGRTFAQWVNLRGKTDFTNFWALWGNAGLDLPVDDDRELRTFRDPVKKYLRRNRAPWASLGFDTAGNRPWYVRVNGERSWREGGPTTVTRLFQILKPSPALEFQLQTTHNRERGERAWLETTPAGTPVTGLRELQLFDQTLRASYAFSPTLTVQLFSQWLAVAWAFRDLRAYQDDRTLVPTTTGNATAFSFRVWNVNLITRWEFRPGSTAYLVYTHGVATDALVNDRAALAPRTDLAILRHLPSDDAVQIKVSWLFR